MDDKNFIWTLGLTKKLFQLRFEYGWLFRKKKQPWSEFYNILLKNGFPKEMTVNHVRKKWSYTIDSYKIAKRTRNKNWKYYKMFEKHFGKSNMLDKYESWNDEWRLKLITCMTEVQELKLNFHNMWRTIENGLRCQGMPIDCCVYDIKGLWQHIRTTFNRKHRLKIKKGAEYSEWPLYDAMLSFLQKYEPAYLSQLETESACQFFNNQKRKFCSKIKNNNDTNNCEVQEFHWSRDITETFIQIRLQNDWMFREKKWAWNNFLNIMIEEHGFPKTLTRREIRRKWAATFSDYQKAKAQENKSWLYYNLFDVYLGEGSFSLNLLVGWQEEWVLNLIDARTNLENCFNVSEKDELAGWREVEKRLRSMGIPLDHSLLDLPEIWQHLLRTFKWKKKFADKGMLNAQWPYYDAIMQYMENKEKLGIKQTPFKVEVQYDDADYDYEDDIKLFDLKQKMNATEPYVILESIHCRACYDEVGTVNVFEQTDEESLNLAFKLKAVCGVEISVTDKLSSNICLKCKQELESAFKFRRKCQESEGRFQQHAASESIKVEIKSDEHNSEQNNDDANKDEATTDTQFDDFHDDSYESRPDKQNDDRIQKNLKKRQKNPIVRKKKMKSEYKYWKVCEVCGKHTQNLTSHLDMHANSKEYTCDVCDKKFKFKSGLIIHKAVHNPTPKKTCEICGKTFHILAQYRRHFVYHANERKHECDTCGKRFNTLDILRVHKRMHTDERPFSCQECGKTFRTAGCVSRHKRIVHKTKDMKVIEMKLQRT